MLSRIAVKESPERALFDARQHIVEIGGQLFGTLVEVICQDMD